MPSGYTTHLRLVALCAVLIAADVALSLFCINYTTQHGKSVLILFAFEFGLLVIEMFNMSCRYSLWTLDTIRDSGLASKGLYVMITDLICDALRFVTYLYFFALVFVYYGLPIHIIREVGQSFWELQKNANSFIRYLRLTHNLDSRLPDATPEELGSDEVCMICYEGMTAGKKLPCGHIFHLECIRMWFQTRQNCPFCRAEVLIGPTPTTPTPPAGEGLENGEEVPGAVANEQAGEIQQAGAMPAGGNDINNNGEGRTNGSANANSGDGIGTGTSTGTGGEFPIPAVVPTTGTDTVSGAITSDNTAASATPTTTGATAGGGRSSYQPHRAFDSPQDAAHNQRVDRDAHASGAILGTPGGPPAGGSSTPGGIRSQSRLVSSYSGSSRTPRGTSGGDGTPPSTAASAISGKSGSKSFSTPPVANHYTNDGRYSGNSNSSATNKNSNYQTNIDGSTSTAGATSDTITAGTTTTVSTHNNKGKEVHADNTTTTNMEPGFYITLPDICPVYLSPAATSGIVRSLLKGTVVFLTESHIAENRPGSGAGEGRTEVVWGRIPDGWVIVDTLSTYGNASAAGTPESASRPNIMRYRSPGAGSIPGFHTHPGHTTTLETLTNTNINSNTVSYTPVTPLSGAMGDVKGAEGTPMGTNSGAGMDWRSVPSLTPQTLTSFSAMPQPVLSPSPSHRNSYYDGNYGGDSGMDSSYVSYMTPLSQFSRSGQLPTPAGSNGDGNGNMYGTNHAIRERNSRGAVGISTPRSAYSNSRNRSNMSGGSNGGSVGRIMKMRLLQEQIQVLNESVVSISEAMGEYQQNLEDLVQEEDQS